MILTEAGKDIGLGHFTRCSSLAEELRQTGINTEMLVFMKEFDLEDTLIVNADWLNKPEILSPYLTCDLVVIDSYLAKPDFYAYLKTLFDCVVAIDDYNRITYPVDMVINPNIFFHEMDYSNQVAECVGGKKYVILRSEFRKQKEKFEVNQQLKEILITIGGTDYRRILPQIISSCLRFGEFLVTVIFPENDFPQSTESNLTILPTLTATEMRSHMMCADIVISACGQTLHELASLGCPTIGICLDIDQIPNQKLYMEYGFIQKKIQWNDADLEEKIISSIDSLRSLKKRKRQHELSRELLDNEGVSNVVKTLISFMDD